MLERGSKGYGLCGGLLPSSGPCRPRQTWIPSLLHSMWSLSTDCGPDGGCWGHLARSQLLDENKTFIKKSRCFQKSRYQMPSRQTVQLFVLVSPFAKNVIKDKQHLLFGQRVGVPLPPWAVPRASCQPSSQVALRDDGFTSSLACPWGAESRFCGPGCLDPTFQPKFSCDVCGHKGTLHP